MSEKCDQCAEREAQAEALKLRLKTSEDAYQLLQKHYARLVNEKRKLLDEIGKVTDAARYR